MESYMVEFYVSLTNVNTTALEMPESENVKNMTKRQCTTEWHISLE